MTTLQIDSNDKNAIDEIKKFAMQKFHFKVKVIENFKKDSTITLDEKLKILKSYKFKREGNLAEAFSSLNQKIGNIENIDIAKDKQEYFNKKYAL